MGTWAWCSNERVRHLRLFAGALLGALVLPIGAAEPPAKAPERYATREGRKVTFHPSGISLRMPREWMEWYGQFHNNLHFTRDELQKVHDGEGEWDSEYGKVVNAALSFDDCVAHVGGEGWGRQGVSYRDVQLRAYISDLKEREILARIHGEALDVARRVARPFPSTVAELALKVVPDTDVTDKKERQWRKSVIRFPLWYGDYGGVARVRFYVTSIKKETLVLVFMGGDDEEIDAVVRSVSRQNR